MKVYLSPPVYDSDIGSWVIQVRRPAGWFRKEKVFKVYSSSQSAIIWHYEDGSKTSVWDWKKYEDHVDAYLLRQRVKSKTGK